MTQNNRDPVGGWEHGRGTPPITARLCLLPTCAAWNGGAKTYQHTSIILLEGLVYSHAKYAFRLSNTVTVVPTPLPLSQTHRVTTPCHYLQPPPLASPVALHSRPAARPVQL